MTPFDKGPTRLSTLTTLGIVDGLTHAGVMLTRAILFDLDGTLLDSLGDLADSANAVRANVGLPTLADGAVAGGVGQGLGVLLRHCLPLAHHANLDQHRRLFLAHYEKNLLNRSAPFEGVESVLRSLPRPIGLVSNKPRRFGAPIIKALGWHFEVMVFGDDLPQRKPEPEPLLAAAEVLGVAPDETIYVGDHRVDEAAARAAGMSFRAVPWTDGFEERRLERLDELLALRAGGKN